METLELSFNQLAIKASLVNISRNLLQSGKKFVIEMEKPAVTEILELCINQLASMKRLENMFRNRLLS